ncbi:glutamate racemase [bacterium]|nr:glutamate racemase [bacterium]MBU1024884.1 glutamate racemase [bacterium]
MKVTKNAPIGLFDSGLGGLTLLKEVRALLPREDVIYFGDLAHVPYGNRSLEEIEGFALNIIAYLKSRSVKAILIACNTSSSVLLNRPFADIPIVQNLIPVAVSGALELSKNRKIGMIANPGTCASGMHERVLRKENPRAEFYAMPCPKLVPLIESGHLDDAEMDNALEEYLAPLVKKGIDTLIMGCTHYPLAFNAIRRHLPSRVAIMDPASEAVLSLREKLTRQNLVRQEAGVPEYEFITSAYRSDFKATVEEYISIQNAETKVINLWQTEHIAGIIDKSARMADYL